MIDPKELHIGSHVLIDGQLREVFGLGCGRVSYLPHPVSSVAESVLADKVEPIAITAELLTELGFKMTNEIGDERHIAWVRKEPWDAYIEYNMNSKLFFAHFGPFNIIRVDYLHEAEYAFYLAYSEELIKE